MQEEIKGQLDFIDYLFSTFGFQYQCDLSTRPAKHLGTVDMWDKAESALKLALDASGLKWNLNKGDGAFYGPKIDIKVLDCYSRKHQLSTIQLDFNLPMRFNMQYKNEEADNVKEEADDEEPSAKAEENMTEEERYA